MGSDVFHSWARRQQQKKEQEYDPKPGVNRKEKKALLVHPAGDNRNRRTDLHPRSAGREIRAFCESAEVECRWYSGALQRTMTDFGADGAFVGAAAKLKEDSVKAEMKCIIKMLVADVDRCHPLRSLPRNWSKRSTMVTEAGRR